MIRPVTAALATTSAAKPSSSKSSSKSSSPRSLHSDRWMDSETALAFQPRAVSGGGGASWRMASGGGTGSRPGTGQTTTTTMTTTTKWVDLVQSGAMSKSRFDIELDSCGRSVRKVIRNAPVEKRSGRILPQVRTELRRDYLQRDDAPLAHYRKLQVLQSMLGASTYSPTNTNTAAINATTNIPAYNSKQSQNVLWRASTMPAVESDEQKRGLRRYAHLSLYFD